MHSDDKKQPLLFKECSSAGLARPTSEQFIAIPHRDGKSRVQVSIETINKFGGSWSLESAMWH
jgi:hypothetical protein